jgi:multiple antibiotic resistance protein
MKTVAISFGETVGILFPIVDPIGNTASFIALTAGFDEARRRRVITRVALFVVVGLSVFALVGEPLLHFFGISLEALQIAGGIVVAFTGFQMITASERFIARAAGSADIALTPLTIPLLAGPGSMAALLGLDSREANLALALPGMIAGIVVIGAAIFVCFRLGERLSRLLGPGGMAALTIVIGLIVLAIGVEMVVHGIVEHGAVVKAAA